MTTSAETACAALTEAVRLDGLRAEVWACWLILDKAGLCEAAALLMDRAVRQGPEIVRLINEYDEYVTQKAVTP